MTRLRACWKTIQIIEIDSPKADRDIGQKQECSGTFRRVFVVNYDSSEEIEPGEGSFDDPALGFHDKAFCVARQDGRMGIKRS